MQLFPAFLKLNGRRVLVVGGGGVAASKLRGLLDAGAGVTVVAPAIVEEIASTPNVTLVRRRFEPSDLDGAWLVVAAATPEVNRDVARAAGDRRLFVNAVDDPPNASLYLGGVVRRAGVTMAVSTDGRAPAIAGLLREGLDAVLPETDLERWLAESDRLRARWRRDGTPMEARRPELLEALIALYGRDRRPDAGVDVGGFVSLIGAGPGDPDLLTVRGAQRLAEADLVLYDGLVPESTVALAASAQHFSVAKRAGRPAVTQETIHRLMIRGARRGKRVVRLKNGDPFLLGRGGEEALALATAGVPFEVIPGVTSAVAAPGLAGIPVTHRGMTTGFTVVSGHAPDAYEPILRGVAPESMTLVVLMGLRHRERIARMLLDVGWRPGTPAAVVLGAATPGMATWRGRLGALADERFELPGEACGMSPERGSEPSAPGTIVVGEVARLRLLSGVGAERGGDGQEDAEGAAGRRRAGGRVR